MSIYVGELSRRVEMENNTFFSTRSNTALHLPKTKTWGPQFVVRSAKKIRAKSSDVGLSLHQARRKPSTLLDPSLHQVAPHLVHPQQMFSSSAAATAGPFQSRYPASGAETPFHRLKPACVELLSLTGRTTGPAQTQQILAALRRLKSTLRALLADNELAPFSTTGGSRLVTSSEATLTPSLINYVFYPVSELISSAPKGITSLPDSVVELTLDVLALLCSQWWLAWSSAQNAAKQWQTWCDLVILSSSVLGSPMNKDRDEPSRGRGASDEVKLAALHVLDELLSARFQTLRAEDAERRAGKGRQQGEWEWDGISDLPLLDGESGSPGTKDVADQRTAPAAGAELIYPTAAHLAYASTDRVAKGALSYVLSSTFAVAESSRESTEARTAAIGVARNALLLWIGGACTLPTTPSSSSSDEATPFQVTSLHHIDFPSSTSESKDTSRKATALRLRPLLPGITSSLTRLATSRLKSKQDEVKPKATPVAVAAEAIELLGDLLRATLADECLDETIVEPALVSRTSLSSLASSTKVTDLGDFADIDSQNAGSLIVEENAAHTPHDSVADASPTEAIDKETQWALSTLAQVHLALKTFSPLTQPSLPGTSLPSNVHPSVQQAMLQLSVALLSDCAESFSWLDGQLASMARLDATTAVAEDSASSGSSGNSSIETLLTWIVDLASDHNSTSVVKSAKSVFEALPRMEGGGKLRARLKDGSALWLILMQALKSLPAAITAHNDESASRLALRVSTLFTLLSEQSRRHGAGGINSLTKLAQDMQLSLLRLIRPLRVERLELVEDPVEPGSNSAWRLLPHFSGLESSTAAQLSRMFSGFGRSLALSLVHELKASRPRATPKTNAAEVFSVITSLLERAAQLRSVRLVDGDADRRSETVTSLLVAADMLRGVSGCLDNLELGLQFSDIGVAAVQASKQARKVAHRLGKKVFGLVMEMLDGDAEEAVVSSAVQTKHRPETKDHAPSDPTLDVSLANDATEGHTLVERVKGFSLAADDIASTTPDRHGPALDLGFVRAANLSKSSRIGSANPELAMQQRFKSAERSIDLSNALLFALLGSASKLLGQSFRTLLLRGAYPLISGMSAFYTTSSDLVRQASTSAMKDIAFNTAYADVKNCLLDHADYILGAACQRLISGLDEELRSIAQGTDDGGVRGRTGNFVVLPLISAQRAPFVLVEMIRVLGSEIIPMVEDAIDEILDGLDRFHGHPTICDGLLAVLDSILETMATEQAAKATPSLNRQLISEAEGKRDEVGDLKSWLEARRGEHTAFDAPIEGEETSKTPDEEKEDKPSKSQQVASLSLTKSCSFLTHPSPVVRSRVLGLLKHGIETLAPQSRTAELLPIINSAWPFVMTRLGASYSSTKSSRSSQLEPIINLNPAAIGAAGRGQDEALYAKLEEGFVERDPQVWVAAASFVEAAAKNVPDFVGKRVVEEAWPRFETLMTLLRFKYDPKMGRSQSAPPQRPSITEDGKDKAHSRALLDSESSTPGGAERGLISDLVSKTVTPSQRYQSTSHVHGEPPFVLPSASGVPGQLTLCIVTTLTTIVRHLSARMPDEAAWSITTNRFLLDLLDTRQPPSILRAAEGLYIELGKRNPEATVWAVQAVFPKAASAATQSSTATPCFMHHASSHAHAETLHHIVSSL